MESNNNATETLLDQLLKNKEYENEMKIYLENFRQAEEAERQLEYNKPNSYDQSICPKCQEKEIISTMDLYDKVYTCPKCHYDIEKYEQETFERTKYGVYE